MTLTADNNGNLQQDISPQLSRKKSLSFFTLDFERFSVNNAQRNAESKKFPEKFTHVKNLSDNKCLSATTEHMDSTINLSPNDTGNPFKSYSTATKILMVSDGSKPIVPPKDIAILTDNNSQYSPFRPQKSPTNARSDSASQHNSVHDHHQQITSVYDSNNSSSYKQLANYYSDRVLPPPPQLQQNKMNKPHLATSPPSPANRALPPPPPNHTYFTQMKLMMTPPPPIRDGNYLADSSLSVASMIGKKAKENDFPPFNAENLEMFREIAKNSDDPKATLDLAKFLVEGANCLPEDNSKKSNRARKSMFKEAQKIVKKLANHAGMGKQGYSEAQFFLANCYGTGGMELPSDPEKAFTLYVQGSKQNHPGCTFRAAVCYEVGAGTKRDKNHAMQFYRKAANLGNDTAMYKLGMILLKGFLGQPKNPREGISWLKRAAQQADGDHPHALHELGLCYESDDNTSVIPDLDYARELFTQAAQFGYAPSQFKLGLAYENGFLNCPVDPRRSIAWYSKAAEQGDDEAGFALSGWYLTGAEGVLPQNDREAYLWARKAADSGSAKAEYAVGYYTETGTGVTPNLDEAKQWYMRAAAQNYRKAMQRLEDLKHGVARPQQKRSHTRDENNTSSNSKDSECTIM